MSVKDLALRNIGAAWREWQAAEAVMLQATGGQRTSSAYGAAPESVRARIQAAHEQLTIALDVALEVADWSEPC